MSHLRALASLVLLSNATATWYDKTSQKVCIDDECKSCTSASQMTFGACTLGTASSNYASYTVMPADDGKTGTLQFYYGKKGLVNCTLPMVSVSVTINGDTCVKISTPEYTGSALVGPVMTWWVGLLISLACVIPAVGLCWWCCCRGCKKQKAGTPQNATVEYQVSPQYSQTEMPSQYAGAPPLQYTGAPPPPPQNVGPYSFVPYSMPYNSGQPHTSTPSASEYNPNYYRGPPPM